MTITQAQPVTGCCVLLYFSTVDSAGTFKHNPPCLHLKYNFLYEKKQSNFTKASEMILSGGDMKSMPSYFSEQTYMIPVV